MSTELGLRERKKQRTRLAITAAALELFAERGFEGVPVAEIARRAEVSEATVFNYFPTKEDLVYSRLEEFRSELYVAIRNRPAGQSIAEAFRDYLLRQRPMGSTPEEQEALRTITRIIVDSPALLVREREANSQATKALADLIFAEANPKTAGIGPWVVANALMGIHQALIAFTRYQVLGGVSGPLLARRVRAQTVKAFGILESGLMRYPAED